VVDLLVDARSELFELAVRSGLTVLETMLEADPGSLALSSAQRDDVSADRQWAGLRIVAKSPQVADRKPVALRSRRLRKC
jgi:hypothetical protein